MSFLELYLPQTCYLQDYYYYYLSSTPTISYSTNYLKTIPTMHSLLILILIHPANYISPRYKRLLLLLHVMHDSHRIRRNELFSRQKKEKKKMPLARVTKELTQHDIALHLYNHLDPSSPLFNIPRCILTGLTFSRTSVENGEEIRVLYLTPGRSSSTSTK